MQNLTDTQWKQYYIKTMSSSKGKQESIAKEYGIAVKDIPTAKYIGFVKLNKLEKSAHVST